MMRSLPSKSLKIIPLIILFLTFSTNVFLAQVSTSSANNTINSNKDISTAGHVTGYMGYTGPGGVGDTSGIGPLSLWLDANNIKLDDKANLSAWMDKSGYGNTANAPLENEPVFLRRILNGYPVVRFTAANTDYLRVDDDPSIRPADISLFVVGTHTFPNTTYAPFVIKTGTWNWINGYGVVMNSDNDYHRAFVNHWFGNSVIAPHPKGSYEIMTLIYDKTNITLYNDELSQGADNYTTNINQSTNYLYLGISPDGFGTGPSSGVRNPLNGDIAEVIIVQQDVNAAQRIIIHNYLAAKYGTDLDANDVYDEDNVGSGNFDHEVAGIGKIDSLNEHTDAQGSGMLRILNPTDLDDGEFLMWGHDNKKVHFIETSDLPDTLIARLFRTWRVSEVNTTGNDIDVGGIDMRWVLSDMGTINASDLRLLIDTDNDGFFFDETPIAGAIELLGGVYEWSGVTALTNNTRFTIGSINVDAVAVENVDISKEVGINLFPSPVTNGQTLNIEFKNIFASEVLLVLRDIRGREFYFKTIINLEDGKVVKVPIENSVPAGFYLLTAIVDNKMYNQKFIIIQQ